MDGDNQKWKFTEIKENKKIISGAKYKITSKNSKKAIEVGYNSQDNGGTVQQWDYEDGSNQQWFLEKAEDKYYKIIADHSGKVLTVKNESTENGTLVEQREYSKKDSQLWYFSEDPDGYYRIRSKHSGKALDVKNQSKENGALLQIWQNDDGDNQKWSLEMVSYDTYPTVNLNIYYDEEKKQIRAEWDSTEDLIESQLYERCDKDKAFKKISTKTPEQSVEKQEDITDEEETVNYAETVSTDRIKECADFRVVGRTKYGKEILSHVVSIKKSHENQFEETVLDTDKDGIADGYEIWDLSTSPYEEDTDGDGFTDGYEVLELCTNPLEKIEDADYDGDGLGNLEEMKKGTNPYLSDTDLDGINDNEDTEPLKTDVNSKKEAECDFIIPTGYYDKKLCGYDEDGEYYEYVYNALLDVYRYCQTGEDNKIYNFYDRSGNQVGSVLSSDGKNIINTCQYDHAGNITYITHNGFAYDFTYNENGSMTNAKAGGQQLISVGYDSKTNAEKKIKYGNGSTREYVYDETGLLVTEVKIDGKTAYEYRYDADGNLLEEKDCENGLVYSYEYDETGEVTAVKTNQGFSVAYTLDENGEKQGIHYKFGEKQRTEKITRTASEEVESDTTDFGKAGKSVTKKDKNKKQISTQVYNGNNQAVLKQKIGFTDENCLEVNNSNDKNIKYQYDENENITAIYKNGTETAAYEYDFQGRLIRENNKETGTTKLYHYDEGGNITEEQEYPYTKAETIQEKPDRDIIYSYHHKTWKNLLTEYQGEKITYDELGNPLQYTDGRYFTWADGRKLTGISDKNNKIQYVYNDENQRVKKIVNGKETEYNWDEEKLISQKDSSGYIYFLYDSENSLIGFEKENQVYYYEKNGLNDITALYNGNGEKVVEYHYDVWGNLLAMDGDTELGTANPFRYKSYYYDNESALYYLLNRYYDSKVKRFLNADQFISLQEENLLIYGKNNPLKYMDSSGNAVETVVDILSVGYSFVTIVKHPSWANAGYLAWDIGAVIVPCAPGSYVAKGGKQLIKVANKASDFKNLSHMTIGSYSKVKKIFKGCKNVEVHHIIEKRLLKSGRFALKGKRLSKRTMMSIPLEKEFHKEITARWRTEIAYGKGYKDLSKSKMKSAIKNVYYDMPALKKYALKYLDEVWK